MLISDGILFKKYISSGKRVILNTLLKNSRTFSMYMENRMPNIIPKKVANDAYYKPNHKKNFRY